MKRTNELFRLLSQLIIRVSSARRISGSKPGVAAFFILETSLKRKRLYLCSDNPGLPIKDRKLELLLHTTFVPNHFWRKGLHSRPERIPLDLGLYEDLRVFTPRLLF